MRRSVLMSRLSAGVLATILAIACAMPSPGAAQSFAIEDPPTLSLQPLARGSRTAPVVTFDAPFTLDLSEKPKGSAIGREVAAHLNVVPLRSRIWNPNNERFDQVELRAYQDARNPISIDRPYVAPKLLANPGDTVRMFIRNLLPAEADCPKHSGDINTPHCFNVTNLHSHGLWVSPAGISDNVLRTLVPNPTFTYEYEYNIPADHPAGTFWYHPHVHGSTAIQVASGMAGALIIEGSRMPELSGQPAKLLPGDIDVLLRHDGKAIPDHVFVLQQIQYVCRDPVTKLPKRNPDGTNPNNGTWRCDASDVGVLDGYDVIGAGNWRDSGRFTTVNGATAAPLKQEAVAGVPERWRFIHGGVADTIRISIRKQISSSTPAALFAAFAGAGARSQAEVISRECAPEAAAVAQFEIATDGLTRPSVFERTSTIMQPGYRSDILVSFPEPGTYCVINEQVAVPAQGVEGNLSSRRLLFAVTVAAPPQGGVVAAPRDAITSMLTATAQTLPISDVLKTRIVADLGAGLKLSAFTPHESLVGQTIDTQQKLYFSFQAGTRQADGKLGEPRGPGIGHTPDTLRRFDPNDFERTLVVGNTDEWELQVDTKGLVIGHPFHIHVNPFEIIAVEKGGVDQTGVAGSQYFGMKGVWKDTIFVEPNLVVRFRTHYRRYVGDFVLHCHILNHEDEGMMEMVRIADRDANGKPLPFGHGLVDVVKPGSSSSIPAPSPASSPVASPPPASHRH